MWRAFAVAAVLCLAGGPALAHPGHGGAGFGSGLAHPFSGLDHMLAMVAVGLMAARRGGSSRIAWPAAFVLAMLAGYGLGLAAAPAPGVEPAILASVIVLGGLAACARQVGTIAGVALIAAFGACHGYAHGAEAPAEAALGYALGFSASTMLLHGLGLALGGLALRTARPGVLRLLSGGIAIGGLALALAA